MTMVICQSAESIKIDVSKILDAIAKEVSEWAAPKDGKINSSEPSPHGLKHSTCTVHIVSVKNCNPSLREALWHLSRIVWTIGRIAVLLRMYFSGCQLTCKHVPRLRCKQVLKQKRRRSEKNKAGKLKGNVIDATWIIYDNLKGYVLFVWSERFEIFSLFLRMMMPQLDQGQRRPHWNRSAFAPCSDGL